MKRRIIISILVLVALIGFSSSIYIVNEDEVATIKSLGRIVAVVTEARDAEAVSKNLKANEMNIRMIPEKGLHFKIPFIQSVDKYTSKYLTYVSNQEIINTKDSRRIEIQMYAQYRIMDPVIFQLALGSRAQANKQMDDSVYPLVIQSVNNLNFDEFFDQNTLQDIVTSRQKIANERLLLDYGLYVSDIGINRKKFPVANVKSIEEKMTLQIQKESEKLIAEGDSYYVQEQAISDRDKVKTVSEAVEKAAVIRASADAEAIKIYQESLNKDLAFYEFITRMQIYKEMSGKTIFIDKDNAIFELLNGY
ncbi:MAG: hypothetical protein CVU84_12025 [Firmicutes bacterium HGW-Firmicutes-1]|jgi:membrane protease subunit HflC|nr:MAG: hypothetical protein CVU84_12025 [Firmicutes bacterium HGW-Firmicutes-1]